MDYGNDQGPSHIIISSKFGDSQNAMGEALEVKIPHTTASGKLLVLKLTDRFGGELDISLPSLRSRSRWYCGSFQGPRILNLRVEGGKRVFSSSW